MGRGIRQPRLYAVSRAVTPVREAWADADVLRALCTALRDDGLAVHYQPQVDVPSGRVSGFEALLRWTDAEHGAMSPARFIPLAESDEVIHDLGRWVLARACRDARRLITAYGEPLRIAVNMSPLQLQRDGFARAVAAALHDADLPSGTLQLELTEGVPLALSSTVRASLKAIRAAGVSLALDDFGVGHANLSYVVDVPVDTLKIDGRFVRCADQDPAAAAVLRATMLLARGLGLRVVGECVETAAQLRELVASVPDPEAGASLCVVQGYYFSPARDCDTLCDDADALRRTFRERAAHALGSVA